MGTVLLVNQHTVPVFTDVTNAFAKAGFKTILFTGHIEPGGQPVSAGVRIVRSIAYNRKSTATRLFSWLIFSVHCFFYMLVIRHKPDQVLSVTNPPLGPFVTWLVSRLRGISYSVLVYDLYPDAIIQAGLLSNRSRIYKKWQQLNLKVFAGARKIFTLSESMKTAAMVYLRNEDSDKIKVIPNWADTGYIKPILRTENNFIQKHDLKEKLIVLYAGNMGLTHDLESVVDAAELLRGIDSVAFIFMGDGAKRNTLENRMKEKSLPNVRFMPHQDAENFRLAVAAADIGVVTLGIGAEGISVPSKTYVNLAAGVCVMAIAPEASELSRLIQFHEAGMVCKPGDPTAVANLIKEMVADAEALEFYKQNAIRASASYTSANAILYIQEMMGNFDS